MFALNSGPEPIPEMKPTLSPSPKLHVSSQLDNLDLSQYFHLPLSSAAAAIGVGTTAIKQHCRKIGIKRWPYRRMLAIQSRIDAINEQESKLKVCGVASPRGVTPGPSDRPRTKLRDVVALKNFLLHNPHLFSHPSLDLLGACRFDVSTILRRLGLPSDVDNAQSPADADQPSAQPLPLADLTTSLLSVQSPAAAVPPSRCPEAPLTLNLHLSVPVCHCPPSGAMPGFMPGFWSQPAPFSMYAPPMLPQAPSLPPFPPQPAHFAPFPDPIPEPSCLPELPPPPPFQ
eukprot:gnl/Ergobibamus_cyprinoides/375.p1 GENE.gnl/Ergobibamus_cyprinoides/375~~gnl/Ergobibamus_cyprinoides/375.p1  ORF type:complete len:301 (+),score=17.63 gnl/Ergobibamus_cyprinoides/375:48-905(+)